MAHITVALSTLDRAIVLLASALCAVGIGLGVRSTAVADAKSAPSFVSGDGAPPRSGPATATPGAATPAVASSEGELDWSVINVYEYAEGLVGLPDAVKALDGKPVVIRGFLTPLYEFDDIHEFVLVANHMSCCFGVPAGISGQIQVKIAGDKGLPNTNEPIEVRGTFRAVETKEQGYILSIYRIDEAKVRIVGYR